MTKDARKPMGRPPFGAVAVDGQWELTSEGIARAAAKVIEHRTKCKERYRKKKTILIEQYPDLSKSNKHGTQTLLSSDDMPCN